MPIIKQLAYENANKYCKDDLHSHKSKSLNDYIKICRNIDPTYIQGVVQGQVIAMTLQEHGLGGKRSQGASKDKSCFKCGGQGYFRREGPGMFQNPSTGAAPRGPQHPGLCPRCKKGSHWASECRSKLDSQGNPLPPQGQTAKPQGNWSQAPPQGPRVNVYGAMTPSGNMDSGVPDPPVLTNPFSSQGSYGQHQAVEAWTSVPPPEQY